MMIISSEFGLGSGKLRVWESESESVRRKCEKSEYVWIRVC